MQTNQESVSEKAMCTAGPNVETLFMGSINDVSTVTGVPGTSICKALPGNVEKCHKKVCTLPPLL